MLLKWVLRVVAFWQKAQVEFHGQYSLKRLHHFVQYSKQVSWQRVICLMILAPVPCLVAILAFEVIELKSPDAGIAANWAFWLRLFGINWISLLASMLQFHRMLCLPPMNMLRFLIVTALSNVIPPAVGCGLAHLIGFPVPFITHLVLLPWIIGASISTVVMFKPYLHQFSALKPNIDEFNKISSITTTLIVIYPLYSYIFPQLDPSYQGVFSLILPAMKMLLKNIMSSSFRINTDRRPEEMVFAIEVFASLFATFSLQSSSIQPIILLSGIDIAHACISLYDILSFAALLEHSRAKLQMLQPDHQIGGPLNTKSIDILVENISVITMQLSEDSKQRIASAAQHRAQYPIRIVPDDEESAHQSRKSIANRITVKPQSIVPRLTTFAILPGTKIKLNVPHISGPHVILPKTDSELVARQKEDLVLEVLRFLHATEYIVLVEFVKIIIPTIYGTMLLRALEHLRSFALVY